MAKNISTTFSIDLSGVVSNAITTVKAIRKSETARKEAEFQRAIANGLSYDEQLRLREKQLETEKGVALSDPDFITTLEKSITDTKKLNRFNKYRTNYATSLGNLSSGKINEEQYLSILKNNLNGIDDPELRLEIQGDIATAEGRVKTYKDTILSNQVKKAKYDGTASTLNDAISRVNTARAEALINDNQDEVSAYDETLSALNSQISSVKIQDSITEFQVKSSTRGTSPVEKLDFISSEIQKADAFASIKIGDRTYASAQQFWSLERDNYLAGTSQVFGKFFTELELDIKEKATKTPVVTQSFIDDIYNTFNKLASKPEITPFMGSLDSLRVASLESVANKYADRAIDYASATGDFTSGADSLRAIETKYGVSMLANQTKLINLARGFGQAGYVPESTAEEVASRLGEAELPDITTKPSVKPGAVDTTSADFISGKTTKPAVPTKPVPTGSGAGGAFQEGDIVPGKGTLQPDGTYRQAGVTTPAPTPTPQEGDNVPGKGILQPDGTYRASTTPTIPTAKPGSYTGSSIVDYLKSVGQDTSVASRAKIALEKGVVQSEDEYLKAAQTGQNATMNTKLLETLRKEQQ